MDAHDRMFGEIAVRLELLTREQLTACRKAQADSAQKRSLAQLALALGLMSEAEIQMVAQQQRKVLDRRREAREGAHRDAAVATHPDRPARPMARASHGSSAARESGVAKHADGPAHDGRPSKAESRSNSRADRPRGTPPPVPPEALESRPPQVDPKAPHDEREPTIPRVPSDPRGTLVLGDLDNAPHVAANQPTLAPPSRPGKDDRPGKKTDVPPARARKIASPPPANTNHEGRAPGPGMARGIGGTLLAGSGRSAQLDMMRAAAPAANSLRPAADRGWRNPSKPPPPQAAAPPGPLGLAALGGNPRGTLAWNPAETPNARPAPNAQTAPTQTRYIDQLLALAIDTGASDLHAHAGSPVLARVDGALWPLTADAPLSPAAAEQVIAEIMTDAQWDALQLAGEIRFAYELAGVGRFRAHAYRQEHGLDIVFRALPTHIADPKDLMLPSRMLMHLLESRSGLFIVSGPPGSGKTTTLATLVHVLANEHNLYVATAESPIEIEHGPGLGLIEQREIPTHAHNFAECIEQALRQSADVIVVSELGSPSSIEAALHAALSGCAVLASVQAESPWSTLSQLLSHFSGPERASVRTRLALAIRGVFTLHLVPRSAARGRVPAVEMLLANPLLSQFISDEQFDVIESLMSANLATGMQTLENALHELVRARVIAPEIAQRAARRELPSLGGP